MTNQVPDGAEIVLIGGGIIGCSTAYHLALNGAKDVVLLERAQLTSGSTFHAAGLVGQLRSSRNTTQLLKYSVELYETLEATTGQATGWKQNGGLRVACTADRLIELERSASTARSFGLDVEMISPTEAKRLWPMMETADIVGAAYLPADGQANPSDITQALARGARSMGVTIVENCNVTGIGLSNGRVASVETDSGPILCDTVVNCAGQWAREVGQMAGVSVPLVSLQHQYAMTEPIEGIGSALPTLRDPDRLTYFKEEVGGLVVGGYEPNPLPWANAGIPEDFNGRTLAPDWGHFEPLFENAIRRVPALESVGIRMLLNGPESFTPDGNFILGEAPEVSNYFVGAGFNAFGIAAAGGAGRALAEWVIAGEQPADLWPVDIRRFGSVHRDLDWVLTRTMEMYGKHYTVSWPHEEHESARSQLRSPLYDTLASAGACFGSKLGWERPNWFATDGERAKDSYSFDRQNWFDAVGREHAACRERVALFDQTSFAKFEIAGPDAERALQHMCGNDIDKAPGTLTYTQMLNDRGGIECDLTVSRLESEQFYVVTGTGFRTHDLDWIERGLAPYQNVEVRDVTEDLAVLTLMGPRARDVLSSITDDDVSNSAMPFGSVAALDIGGTHARAIRVTYVGELGWEIHVARSDVVDLYRFLMNAGQQYGIANAGYRAIESLRLEKGYRAWGADIGPDHTPLEAGMSWALKLGSGVDFRGRVALEHQARDGLTARLACFTVTDPSIVLLGKETIYRNDRMVGWLTSGGWGYTVGENIGYGYVRSDGGVDREHVLRGRYELDVAGDKIGCDVHLGPLYDRGMSRVKS